jgi:hypothetical protein
MLTLLTQFTGKRLRFHGLVEAVAVFSTSQGKTFFTAIGSGLSILHPQNRLISGGWENDDR